MLTIKQLIARIRNKRYCRKNKNYLVVNNKPSVFSIRGYKIPKLKLPKLKLTKIPKLKLTVEQKKERTRMRKSKYRKFKTLTDPNYRIRRNLRTRIKCALDGKLKHSKTMELLGCSIESFRKHLEERFQPNMGWHNYGSWHIDHIRPCASFDLIDPEQQKQCFHYTNTQPLWAVDNMKKGNKLVYVMPHN